MPKVRLLNGKPLMVNGKVAISDNCCCGGGTSTCPPPDAATIQITFADILVCAPFFDISANGTFTLIGNGAGEWDGVGGQILHPVLGPVDLDIVVICFDAPPLQIDYSFGSDDPAVFLVLAENPPITPVDNYCTDCATPIAQCGAYGGTATLIF